MANINDYGFPFTSVAGDRQYGSDDWRTYFDALGDSGVVDDVLNELAVAESTVPARSVQIATGAVCIKGALIYADSISTLTFTTNTSGSTRIDRVVARLNYDDRKIEFAVLQGTPSGSPVAPSLTQNTTYWELSLAKVTLANGYTTITNANITDERSDDTVCGYTTFRALNKVDKIVTGTNAKTYAYTRTQTSDSTATQGSIEVETVPVASSSNVVTSGGVYSKDIRIVETSDTIDQAQLVREITNKIYHQLSKGVETEYESANTSYISIAEINANTFVIAYKDAGNSNYGTAGVVTVDDDDITLVDTVVFESANTSYISVCKVDTNKALVCYTDVGNSAYGTACVLSYNGTDELTAGTPAVFESATTTHISVCQLDTDKAIVCYRDDGNSYYGTANVLTVSGTDVAGNTPYVYDSRRSDNNVVVQVATDKAVVINSCVADGYNHTCILSVSTTTISSTTASIFSTNYSSQSSATLIDTGKILVCYNYANVVDYKAYGKAKLISIVAPYTALTYSNISREYLFEAGDVYLMSLSKIDTNKAMVLYTNNSATNNARIITYDGRQLNIGAPLILTKFYATSIATAQVTTDKIISAYDDETNNYGKATIFTRNDATGYALAPQFSTNELSGNASNINVVPYIPLT